MTAIIVLIAFSLLLAVGFLISFLLSVKNGQFDDTYTPSIRMLFDDELKSENESEKDAEKFLIENPKS